MPVHLMPYKPPSAFGKYLKSKRLAANLSLRDVANRIGVSFVFLGEVERGVRTMVKRERWPALEQAIPGFSVAEAERVATEDRPIQLSLADAPPQYKNLGLALARRIDKRDLRQTDFDELLRILNGGADDDDG